MVIQILLLKWIKQQKKFVTQPKKQMIEFFCLFSTNMIYNERGIWEGDTALSLSMECKKWTKWMLGLWKELLHILDLFSLSSQEWAPILFS